MIWDFRQANCYSVSASFVRATFCMSKAIKFGDARVLARARAIAHTLRYGQMLLFAKINAREKLLLEFWN